MKIEHAHRNRSRILVPTPADYTEAASKGVSLTSAQLTQLRAKTHTPKPAVVSGTSDTLTITKLRQQVEKLRRENAALKLRILTGN